MTYCLALRLDDGLVFMADKRSIRPSRLTSNVHQLARMTALVAVGWLGRLGPGQAPEAGAGQDAGHRRARQRQGCGDLGAAHAKPARGQRRPDPGDLPGWARMNNV